MGTTHTQCSGGSAASGRAVTVDFVALLSRLGTASTGEGATTTEIAEAMGCGVDKVRKLIKQAIADGKYRATRKAVTTIAGTQSTAVSYVLMQEEEQ